MSNNSPPPKKTNNNEDKQTPNNGNPMGRGQNLWIIAVVVAVGLFLFVLLNSDSRSTANTITFNALAEYVQAGEVTSITIRGGQQVAIELDSGETRTLYKDPNTDILQRLEQFGVTPAQYTAVAFNELQSDGTANALFQILISVGPLLIIVWLLWRMMRSVRGGQDQAMNFGRSRARVARDLERPQVRFTDVAGNEEAKEELEEIVEFLKEPEKFIQLGARIPKGVLMIGPPGTGKTLMARAVAGEAGVPFFHISGSEFVEMFVGVGASRVRDLFDNAKKEAPAIIFIDEIDAVGRQRGAGLGGGHDEREQTLNQILVEMDGFENDTNIIMIAATNRPDILDPALLRPGRFDRKVTMDTPDVRGRLEILNVHARGKPLGSDVNLEAIAKISPGMSGADLENLLNEAALLAARRNKRSIGMSEMNEAMERVALGPARKSRVISADEKRLVAYHEGGHALLFHMLEHADPVHKITIVPRGRAGGYVLPLPETEQMIYPQAKFEDLICAGMGGRAAEFIIYNRFTTGAASDLEQATNRARAMVTQFGMSEKLGPRTFGSNSGNPFLGRGWVDERDYSEEAARVIDEEVRRIVSTAYDRAVNILSANRGKLEMLAQVLMERETLDRAEFEYLMEHGELDSRMLDPFAEVPLPPERDAERGDSPPLSPDTTPATGTLGTAPA